MCSDPDLLVIVGIAKKVIGILQIGIPIALLIFGTLDLGKAVMAGDEKEIKTATNLLIKRIIAALAVFILIFIVKTVTGWVGGTEWKNCWNAASTGSKINPM